ncbi:hypothetical protein [Halovenus marina]|uniref:hypothetical protein n=1 Tax=Halovenus marina TaxID=3396621 RepID=UPI003F573AAB
MSGDWLGLHLESLVSIPTGFRDLHPRRVSGRHQPPQQHRGQQQQQQQQQKQHRNNTANSIPTATATAPSRISSGVDSVVDSGGEWRQRGQRHQEVDSVGGLAESGS